MASKPSAKLAPKAEPPVEIESIEQLKLLLASGASLKNSVLQGLDLCEFSEQLCKVDLHGAVFLGCEMHSRVLKKAQKAGALIFPPIHGLPYNAYRGQLYTAEELYRDFDWHKPESYQLTPDARIFKHFEERGAGVGHSILDSLAQRLHDHAISDALDDLLLQSPRKVVAIMGGHEMKRGAADYAQVARLSRDLTRLGFFMISGGGPVRARVFSTLSDTSFSLIQGCHGIHSSRCLLCHSHR
jgi:hypothetical protein